MQVKKKNKKKTPKWMLTITLATMVTSGKITRRTDRSVNDNTSSAHGIEIPSLSTRSPSIESPTVCHIKSSPVT